MDVIVELAIAPSESLDGLGKGDFRSVHGFVARVGYLRDGLKREVSHRFGFRCARHHVWALALHMRDECVDRFLGSRRVSIAVLRKLVHRAQIAAGSRHVRRADMSLSRTRGCDDQHGEEHRKQPSFDHSYSMIGPNLRRLNSLAPE